MHAMMPSVATACTRIVLSSARSSLSRGWNAGVEIAYDNWPPVRHGEQSAPRQHGCKPVVAIFYTPARDSYICIHAAFSLSFAAETSNCTIEICALKKKKLKKLKIGHLYNALVWELTTKALRIARVNKGSHSFTCYPHVYPRMEWAILHLHSSRSASPHFGRYSFPVTERVGGWVGLGGWLHIDVICPPEEDLPFHYQPIDSATAGIELAQFHALTTRLPSHHVCARYQQHVSQSSSTLGTRSLKACSHRRDWTELCRCHAACSKIINRDTDNNFIYSEVTLFSGQTRSTYDVRILKRL